MVVPAEPSGPVLSLDGQVAKLRDEIGGLRGDLTKLKSDLAKPGFFDFTSDFRTFARFYVQQLMGNLMTGVLGVGIDGITFFGKTFGWPQLLKPASKPEETGQLGVVRKLIDAERAQREAAVARVSGRVVEEWEVRSKNDFELRRQLQLGLLKEEVKRISGDRESGSRIELEASRRNGADSEVRLRLNTRIEEERRERSAAEARVNGRVNEEQRLRSANDSKLNGRIDAASRRGRAADTREAERLERAVRNLAEAVRENEPGTARLANQLRAVEESLR
jgi:hypothetical protein